jgi:protocatechuate 3,4-dioxygenase alpha subunit
MSLPITPSQTVGPFLTLGLTWPDGINVVPDGTPGAVRIRGRIFDGDGNPVPDALVETWQADGEGRFSHPDDPRGLSSQGFRGVGRCPTDPEGWFTIVTVKPGSLPAPDGRTEAPHIDVSLFARGLLNRLVTRIYFPDEVEANAADPVLQLITDPEVRSTLVATAEDGGLRFDIHLQGDHETAFFEV